MMQYVQPDGKQFTYTYDEMGRPKSLSEVTTNCGLVDAARDVHFNAAGQLKHLEYRATQYNDIAPSHYVVSPSSPQGKNRQAAWDRYKGKLSNLFQDRDCFGHI